MRFNPKLVHAEEPPTTDNGDLELPDDLAALAQQLAEDSAHLASCYPSPKQHAPFDSSGQHLRSTGVWTKRIRRTGIAAASLAGIAVLAWAMSDGTIPEVAESHQPVDSQQAAVATAPVRTSAANGSQRPLTAVPNVQQPVSLSLAELSGPELEAVLDLIEREPEGVASRVSF